MLGPNLVNMIIVLGVAGWPIYARTVRAETLTIRERDFVVAARALGMSHLRLVFRQIVPNLVSVIVVIATLQVAQVIVGHKPRQGIVGRGEWYLGQAAHHAWSWIS